MPLDGFLEIQHQGGAVAIKGECRDRTFALRGAMAINSFEFGSEGHTSADKDDKESKKAGHGAPSMGMTSTKLQGTASAPQLQFGNGASQGTTSPELDWTTTLFFKIKKDVDLASPELFLAYCENTKSNPVPFHLARVTLRRAGGSEPQVYLVVEFNDVFVASYSIEGGSKDELPEESVEFCFRKMIKVTYRPQTVDGHGSANIKNFRLKDRPTT